MFAASGKRSPKIPSAELHAPFLCVCGRLERQETTGDGDMPREISEWNKDTIGDWE